MAARAGHVQMAVKQAAVMTLIKANPAGELSKTNIIAAAGCLLARQASPAFQLTLQHLLAAIRDVVREPVTGAPRLHVVKVKASLRIRSVLIAAHVLSHVVHARKTARGATIGSHVVRLPTNPVLGF